ncbi:MAG: bifunctional [glutamate--ammonia ligase]-adenylyl-L-tyrosine phosphorylase/[glutamate--ammonia-ligase] adenylyltransferase [Bacteroidales bacterium]|nr:bifunctional [glutamate--ammonia ligase]-adenylyl-L-tyrosine phosphorylase/[glutamate--ammonia-ligase] adenylyltransferase [Bacteroidales bacterium]
MAAALAGVTAEADLHKMLRCFRQREMVRILWRDFTRRATTLDTTRDTTLLAEACVQGALDVLYPQLCADLGTPHGKTSGAPQRLVVLGMGKMGAWELNVSSDIDLIFAFPEGGETEGGRRQFSNQEFFTRLGQKLIQALDNKTADGFVFRVDMRLRPYGQSGALALNFDAMADYYHTQGRDWERYAMIKARVVAGDRAAGEGLMAILRPFTYRKYIDYSAIQSLRDMKGMINREIARLGMAGDIKKGAGGIREVEFVAQAFQLIRGGKDARFRNPVLRDILPLLETEGLLPGGVAEDLWRAYLFLRDTEHALQGHRDQQTQQLPEAAHTRAIIAAIMGFENWQDFAAALEQHRARVHTIFTGIVSEPVEGREESEAVQAARALWLTSDEETMVAELAGAGFDIGDILARELLTLRHSRSVKGMVASVRNRLDTFMPQLIAICGERPDGGEALRRILPLVQGIVRRSAYLVLLIENPEAMRQLVRLCAGSTWIAEQISRYPALLDELLDPRTLYTAADRHSIAQDLHQQVMRIAGDDLEGQMEALRYFRRAHALRIAAAELTGVLPLMKISDNLTWLAEAILEHVLALAWEWVVARHGLPGREPDGPEPGMLVVGYGKLGGIELGHGSDLDLVFIHSANPNLSSDGEKTIDNATFFMRLGQRMIHILTTQTVSGSLYEVDMRLRPNGNSGMLVTSITAFDKYQEHDAWTWEHQALARARPVAGDPAIADAFAATRHRVLCRRRDPATLQREVLEMREKMRAHLGTRGGASADSFDIKQDTGGIVDIEFIVQYLALRHACDHPELVKYTDNMRMLDAIRDSGLLPPATVEQLQEGYIFFRGLGHRLNLQGQAGSIDESSDVWKEARDHSVRVEVIWRQLFAEL